MSRGRPKVYTDTSKVVTFRIPYGEWKPLHDSHFNFGKFCRDKVREEVIRLKGLTNQTSTNYSFTDQVIGAVNEVNKTLGTRLEDLAWERDSFTHDEIRVIRDYLISHGVSTSQKAVYDVMTKVYITDRENGDGIWKE